MAELVSPQPLAARGNHQRLRVSRPGTGQSSDLVASHAEGSDPGVQTTGTAPPTGPTRVPSPASDHRPFPSLSTQCWKTFFSLWHQIFATADNQKDLIQERFPGLSPLPHVLIQLRVSQKSCFHRPLTSLPHPRQRGSGRWKEKHVFLWEAERRRVCEVLRSEGGSDRPEGPNRGLLPGGSWTPQSPHPRITRPQRPRGPAKCSTARRVGEFRHAPINDSSFMKEEQSNGNLCCIESVREKAGQAPLDSWRLGPCPTQSRRRGSERLSEISVAPRLLFQPPAPPSAVHRSNCPYR